MLMVKALGDPKGSYENEAYYKGCSNCSGKYESTETGMSSENKAREVDLF